MNVVLRFYSMFFALAGCIGTFSALATDKLQHLTSPDQVPQGLAKSDWSSIRAAYEAGRHAFQPIEGGWQARNPGQQWLTKFDGRGFVAEPRGGGWQWGLELRAYGFPGAVRRISDGSAVKAEGQRLTYDWDATLQEWFVNDQRGLEHGYTVQKRPAGATDAPLEFQLAVRGSLTPKVAADGKGVEFCDTNGAVVLNYAGLKVWDADGKVLTSRFASLNPQPSTLNRSVTLLVEEKDARYPVTIDPIAQQAYVKTGPDSGISFIGDAFGSSVAISGDTVVVGATGEDSSTTGVNSTPNESAGNAGAAYVFVRSGSTWSQQAYLKPAAVGTTQVGDEFGYSVAISGDTLVVGARSEDSSTTGINNTPDENAADSGAVYVFVRSGANWSQQAFLKPAAVGTSQAGDLFGNFVAISGDTIVVGAPGEDSSTTGVNSTPNESAGNAGAAYVFVRSGTSWSQQAYLKPAAVGTTQASDQFGQSVAISGDTVVVGALWESSSTTGINSTPNDSGSLVGAAYVFIRSGTTWTQQAYLKPAAVGSTQDSDQFGQSVAISGDTLVVGAPNEGSSTTGINGSPNESSANSGAVYVFVRIGATWSQQAYLKPAAVGTTQAGDRFGYSVAISSNTVVVGALAESSSTTGINSTPNENASNAGAAYVFERSGTTWSQQAYLKPAAVGTTQASDNFGNSVAISGDTLVVGAYFEDGSTTGINGTPNEGASFAGAANVFVRSGTTWSQQAYLKIASDSGISFISDAFGQSVAISGDTVVVGAVNEDSSTTGVNSTPDESASGSGAAYVFVRSGTTWSQQAYLKPAAVGTTLTADQFGQSVAISGDTLVVGAYQEDSSTTGVNSTPDESASSSGAAYVFVRSGTTWSQQAYLKASNTGAGDRFGIAVSVSGDSVVVGADSEDSSTTGVDSTPNESASGSGAVYVFVRSGTTWSQQAYLKASNAEANDQFGRSVSISSNTIVIGAQGEDSSTTGVNSTPNESAIGSGAAYVFFRNGGVWSQQAYLKPGVIPTGTALSDSFGSSVAVSEDTVVVGAVGEDSSTTGINTTPNESAADSGAAYVFVRNGSVWSQQAYLKPAAVGTTQAGDSFGRAVAISGNALVIGAHAEDSSTGSSPNEFLSASGAAYVFVRSGTTWSQQAYLKASNVGASDGFGTSVAISGDTIVVGAPGEDSGTTGINSAPNEGAIDSGATYIFVQAPEMDVMGNGLSITDGDGSPSTADDTDFGTTFIGTGTVVRSFTITNSGTGNLNLSGSPKVVVSGSSASDFVVTAQPFTPVLLASNVSFQVTFTPSASGLRIASLSITNNDPDENPYNFTIRGTGTCPTIALSPATLPNGIAGIAYNQTVTASGGTAPYTFALASGTLPAGLNLSSAGVVSGTPTNSGVFTFTITAIDSYGCTGSSNYTINVNCSPILLGSLPDGSAGTPYTNQINVQFGGAPFTFSTVVGSNTLPSGLTLTSNGSVQGIPTALGTFGFAVQVVDAYGCTASKSYAVTIGCPTISVTPAALSNSTNGVAYSRTLSGSGGISPYTLSVINGTLPVGLVLNTNTGVLAGTPTSPGIYSFTVQATDANGCVGSQAYSFTNFAPATLITFSAFPGPDNTLGTGDDVPVTASLAQARFFTNEFARLTGGVGLKVDSLYEPNPPLGTNLGAIVTYPGGNNLLAQARPDAGPGNFSFADVRLRFVCSADGIAPVDVLAVSFDFVPGISPGDLDTARFYDASGVLLTNINYTDGVGNNHISYTNWNGIARVELHTDFSMAADNVSFVPLPTTNHPPLAGADSAGVPLGQMLTVPAVKLLANDTDADGDALSILSVVSPSVLGASVSLASGTITYNAPASGTSDSFSYIVGDGRGGTNTGTVNVTLSAAAQGFNQLTPQVLTGGDIKLSFLGIPGLNYALDRTHELTPPVAWEALRTNAAATNGWLLFTNTPSLSPTNDYYRTRHVP